MLKTKIVFYSSLVIGLSLMGCSKPSTQRYAGSGSDWAWELNSDGSFSAAESTTSSQVSGSYARLGSGFVKLMVSKKDGASSIDEGSVRYGLEVPGVAFLSQPMLRNEGIIVAVSTGVCPTADYSANWILTQYPRSFDMSLASAKVFGVFSWNQESSSGALAENYAIAGDYQSNGPGSSRISGTCSGGITPASIDGSPAKMYLTEQGGAVVRFEDEVGVLALPAVPLPSKAALAGEYAGLVINQNDLFSVRAARASIDSTGTTVSLDGLWSVDPELVDSGYHGSATIDEINAPGDGFVKVTVQTGSGTGKMACMASVDVLGSGKNIFFCVGQAPGYPKASYNVLLVSK